MLKLLFITLLVVSACRTTEKQESSGVKEMPLPPPAASADCDEPVFCTADYNPAHCQVPLGDMPPSVTLHVWASNACKARADLKRRACQLGWAADVADDVECAPNKAPGMCPPADAVCPQEATPSGPALCLATSHAGEPFAVDTEVRGYGVDACSAKAALSMAACRRGLDPTQLGGVTCGADPTAGECVLPLDPPECRETTQRPASCEATRALGVKLDAPILGEGKSACAAKRWLVYKACQRGLKPSALEEVICRFKK